MTKNRSQQEVETGLLNKGFQKRGGDHNYFIYHSQAGQKTRAKTKISRGSKSSIISGDLVHFMAKQCFLTNDQFLQLVDCPLSRNQYEDILAEKNELR